MVASPSIAPSASAARAAARSRGLSQVEASQRLAKSGRPSRRRTSRSYASIVRANVFTVFNLILAVAGAATLAFGEWQDALFLGVLFANATIGTAQEVRAKRALDRLSAALARCGSGRGCFLGADYLLEVPPAPVDVCLLEFI
jgi:magnesium-transporting ATPase (P-type)